MNKRTTRRGFLQKSTAAGGCLVLPGLSGAASPRNVVNAPIILVTQAVSTDVNPRAGTWVYITEVLQRAGLFFEQIRPSSLPSLRRQLYPIVLLAGDLHLTPDEREVLATWVQKGGSVIGIGGTSGLDQVFGVSGCRRLAEGWIKVTAQDHPVTAGLRSSLHVFGGCAATARSATSLADLESGRQGAKGSAILENRFGKGRAILLAPDLIFSIVHIQQGVPVFQDAKPAPDGSAPFNDGALKAEDGCVLDWQRDRTPMQPDGVPGFLEPITDELRELILRSIFHVAKQQGVALPMLWYWPRGLKAVAHMSHDTDGHEPHKATALLEVMNRCNVKSTWCTMYPGGYPREFYRALKQQGYEIALHYDAMSGGARTSWSKENFFYQHHWLMKEAGLTHITSNKNHSTRWEGRLDFLRWCEEIGITCDQTRGPSKKGATGFPLGGSQPYFPLDDERGVPRLLNVLQAGFLTQDLIVYCSPECGRQLMDSVLRHHGVAHFLFHPFHILTAGVADALCDLVDYGRTQGLEWWTNEQIYQWEMSRRGVKANFHSYDKLTLRATKPLHGATLLFLKSREEPRSIIINGQVAHSNQWVSHGFEFDAATVDLRSEVRVQVA